MAKWLAVTLLAVATLWTTVSGLTDVEILNFALNLEYAEATFYSYAAFGVGLSSADRGGGPEATGGFLADLSPVAKQYATDIANDEIAHVRFLRAALGASAVPAPLIDLSAFKGVINAAVGITLSPDFSAFSADELFYLGAYVFEDVGATAYKGAARFISNPAFLEAAAGILAVEAYHAGAIRERLYAIKDGTVYPYRSTITRFTSRISALRQTVSGVADVGIEDSKKKLVIAPADADAIIFSRLPSQVLPIVYAGGTNKGGFFPNGFNGSIK